VAQSRQEQRASYPLAAYNFRVIVDAETLSFAKVSGLTRQHQTVTYNHGLSFLEGELITKFHVEKYTTVTLERGSTVGARALHKWLEDSKPRVVEVQLCDADGRPVVLWRIARAIAVKLTAPTFDARANEAAIESLELKAAGINQIHLT